ncbi:MAG: ABC transporter ATP-binding protein [Lachnospiraceae bacterium]|nr:ABC transporter ATP-binding protein [Lachnospiraceae bacterium]
MKELKRYFSYIGKYKVAYWTVFIMTLITSVLLNLAYPYMNKLIFNAVEYRSSELLNKAIILCIIVVLLNCLAPYRRYFQIKIVRKIVFDIKIRLFEKLMKMDMNYYENHHSGEALKILNWDANSLKDSYFSHVFWVAGRLVNGVTSLVAMLIYSPTLMLVSVGFCLITVYISIRINRQIKEEDKKIQKRVSSLTNRLSDILTGFTELKMYHGASIVYDDFYKTNETVLEEETGRAEKAAGLEMVAFFLGILASFGTTFVGAYLVSEGKLDYGTVMAVVSLQMGVSTLMQGFGSALTTFSASLVKAGRVFDFLESEGEEKADEKLPEETITEKRAERYPIEVKNVTFSYDGERKALKDFSMRLAKNEKVMLRGESGCGKSTLLKLLMGFYQKKEGTIRLYGKEIDEYSLFQLRQLITYMPQRSYLFEGTVRENIAIGADGMGNMTEDEITRAARMAYADEFIRELPQGYDTYVSAGGSNFSVGQRQRIALARAFLKNSPILLMDEPSSALDAHSEKMIHRAMSDLMKNKTVIMVTHREMEWEGFSVVHF